MHCVARHMEKPPSLPRDTVAAGHADRLLLIGRQIEFGEAEAPADLIALGKRNLHKISFN